jgi:hypothetical protein
MKLVELFESSGSAPAPRWWEGRTTGVARIYHGTSSALLPKIRAEGLVPPGTDTVSFRKQYLDLLDGWLRTLEDEHGPIPTDTLMDLVCSVDDGSLGYRIRHRHGGHPNDAVVYLTPSLTRAAGYARSYCEDGGEVASEIWAKIRDHTDITPPRRFAGGLPVVIEVEVPWAWLRPKNEESLDAFVARMERLWEGSDRYQDQHATFNDFMAEEVSDFEIRVSRAIPPEMIRIVHPVSPRR